MFELGSVLTLSDNNEYIVVGNAEKDGKNYYYLVDKENLLNVQVLVEKTIDNKPYLQEISDPEILKEICPIMIKNAKKFFND